jgi:hypothetical protein
MGHSGSVSRDQALVPISGDDRAAVVGAFASQPADPLPLKDLERDLRSHLVNFVLIAPSTAQRECVWYKPLFSVWLLYSPGPPEQPWVPKVVTHRIYEFVVLWIDLVSAVHVTFFLNKSKIYIRRSEFLKRLIVLSSAESIEIPIVSGKQAPRTVPPFMGFVDPTTNPLMSQSESMFQSSSHAAFQDYRRAKSYASQSAQPESEVRLSSALVSEATMDSAAPSSTFHEYSYAYSSALTQEDSEAGARRERRLRSASVSESAASSFVDE